MSEEIELVHGSGNVFRDFGHANADVEQTKAILAAKIIGILDERDWSIRKAEAQTGINHSEFARIRNVKLDRFTIDRLIRILNVLDDSMEIRLTVQPRTDTHTSATVEP
ncbi:MAG: XRE family transcriptional regulator [Rhodospirillales bacterium]|nr:XRE family transcriptional regulator [Rhodospirillales bacterium]